MFVQKSSKKAQRGQGMVEYLLILVLAVAMISALGRGLARPLKDYIEVNIIGVVGCMLRVGQFPDRAFGECQQAALEFNVAGSFNSNSSSNGGGSNSSNNSDDSSPNDSSEGSESNNEQRNRGNGDDRFRPSSNRNGGGSVNESSGGFGDSDTKTIKISNGNDSGTNGEIKNSSFLTEDGSYVSVRKIKKDDRIGGSFLISGDSEKTDDGPNATVTSTTKALPPGLKEERQTENSFSIPKPTKRNIGSVKKDEGLEFSFFGMVKWGLIIAILAMLAFFTFSQLNSIRKGMD